MYAIDIAFNAIPLKKYNFNLCKSEFRDGIALRYCWEPPKLASNCVCGEPFTVAHVLYCPRGGYTHLRHNDIRDSFANLLEEICFDVKSSLIFCRCKVSPLQIKLPALKMTHDWILKPIASGTADSQTRFSMSKSSTPLPKAARKISKTRIATMKISKN